MSQERETLVLTTKEQECVQRIKALREEKPESPWERALIQQKIEHLVVTLSGLYHKDHYAHPQWRNSHA